MALAEGTRLGPYEIVSPVGAGGMGEVYRARDTRLDRLVAIKVLAEALNADLQLKRRLESEARTISRLAHPHICTLYDVGNHDGAAFLVMELLQGETLAARLARGALPCPEALAIAVQIASGLDAAHRTGIVHRDLKPANIFLSRASAASAPTAKILDFGLAKTNGPLVSGTVTSLLSTAAPRLTEPTVVLGTVGYMAPEQIEGLDADARTDVFAFGAVLYEMLTGQRAFQGTTPATVMAAIMQTAPPPVSAHGPVSSGALDRVVQKCLAKNADDRWQSTRDLRDELAWLSSPDAGPHAAQAAVQPNGNPAEWRRAVLWAAAGVAGAMVVLLLWAPWRRPPPPLESLRVRAALGVDASLVIDAGAMSTAAVLSQDGSQLAFVAQSATDATTHLYVRRLDQLEATRLSGTDNAHTPFFSPDGQWLAFFANGQLKKISVTGGAAIVLCQAPNGRGGAWGEDGTIYISPDNQPYVRLSRVPSTGGTPEPLPVPAEREWHQRWPQVLPGDRGLLYTVNDAAGLDDAHLVVQALPDGPRKVVYRGGYHGRYVGSGHLLYMGDGALRAVPFDIDRLEVTGDPIVVVDRVMSSKSSGGAQFAVSSGGTLAYISGPTTASAMPIHWMDRSGMTTPLRSTPANWFNLRFASDGRRLAMGICDGPGCDIWILDSEGATNTRMTLDTAASGEAVWSPDGRRFAFSATREDNKAANLYWQSADRPGDAERLTHSLNHQTASSWHPSGRLLAFEERTPHMQDDVMILPLEGSDVSGWKPGKPSVFLNGPADEREPMFSPDGRWVAYSSNESGRAEVYVRPFPSAGERLMISAGGGSYPTWSQVRQELFYGTAAGQIMVVPYTVSGSVFKADKPRHWSEGRYMVRGPTRTFDVHPDGERFAVAPAPGMYEGVDRDHVTVVFSLSGDLRGLAGPVPRER